MFFCLSLLETRSIATSSYDERLPLSDPFFFLPQTRTTLDDKRRPTQVTGPSDEALGKKTEEAKLPLPMRQVLIPVDGTPQSEYMIDWAINNFCREGDQVNLIHIIPK